MDDEVFEFHVKISYKYVQVTFLMKLPNFQNYDSGIFVKSKNLVLHGQFCRGRVVEIESAINSYITCHINIL